MVINAQPINSRAANRQLSAADCEEKAMGASEMRDVMRQVKSHRVLGKFIFEKPLCVFLCVWVGEGDPGGDVGHKLFRKMCLHAMLSGRKSQPETSSSTLAGVVY